MRRRTANNPPSRSGSPISEREHKQHRANTLFLVFIVGAGSFLAGVTLGPGWESRGDALQDNAVVACSPEQGSTSRMQEMNLLQQNLMSGERRPTQKPLPHDQFCSQTIQNELQLWNPYKKIITFCLFDSLDQSNRRYTSYRTGLKHNVIGAALYYPGWIIRVYVYSLSQDQIDDLIQLDPTRVEVVTCHEDSAIGRSGSWATKSLVRAFSYDDPSVLVMLARDVDSRFHPRELLAVNQWLSSDQQFHVMRDHVSHTYPIMGGMYGIKSGGLGNDKTTMTSLVTRAVEEKNLRDDQAFLRYYVWPLVRNTTLDHDKVPSRCLEMQSAVCSEWPLVNFNHATSYVGQPMRRPISAGYNCSVVCSRTAALEEPDQ